MAVDEDPASSASPETATHLRSVLERAVASLDGQWTLRFDADDGESAKKLAWLLRALPSLDEDTLGVDLDRWCTSFVASVRALVEAEATRPQSPLYRLFTTQLLVGIDRRLRSNGDTAAADREQRNDGRSALIEVPVNRGPGLIGREDTVTEVLRRLDATPSHSAVTLRALGGVGKTSVAAEVARAAKGQYDVVLWAALGPTPHIRQILQEWGRRQLGVDLLGETDTSACTATIRTLLHDRRALVVVDDAWQPEHVTPFLVVGPVGATLVTTRDLQVQVAAWSYRDAALSLDVLKESAAVQLLRWHAPALAGRPEAVELARRLEWLPLALVLAGRALALAAAVPERFKAVLRQLLTDPTARLGLPLPERRLGIDADRPTLRQVMALSVDLLSAPDQERFAQVWALGTDPLVWDLPTAADVWECSEDDAAGTVGRLVERGLAERRHDRYWVHAVLGDYSRELYDARLA